MNVINKQSPVPYYYQLAELLRELIQNQDGEEAFLLPSETELAKAHNITRATVRQALDVLEREGLIYKEKGRGTFAAKVRSRYSLTTLIPTTDEITRRGWIPSVKVISTRALIPPQHIRQALQLAPDQEVFELCRLRLGNDQPISVQWSYLPAHLCPALLQHDLTQSLTHLLESKYDLRLWTAREILRARLVTSAEAKLLDIPPKSAVLYMERITFSPDNLPLEFLESVWRSDKYDFEFTLSR
jgi:GntR family transcriptional regulator